MIGLAATLTLPASAASATTCSNLNSGIIPTPNSDQDFSEFEESSRVIKSEFETSNEHYLRQAEKDKEIHSNGLELIKSEALSSESMSYYADGGFLSIEVNGRHVVYAEMSASTAQSIKMRTSDVSLIRIYAPDKNAKLEVSCWALVAPKAAKIFWFYYKPTASDERRSVKIINLSQSRIYLARIKPVKTPDFNPFSVSSISQYQSKFHDLLGDNEFIEPGRSRSIKWVNYDKNCEVSLRIETTTHTYNRPKVNMCSEQVIEIP